MAWTTFSGHTIVSLFHVHFVRWDTDQSEYGEGGAWINLIAGWLYRACLFSSCSLERKLGRGNLSLIVTLRQIDLLTSQDGIRSIAVDQSDWNRKKNNRAGINTREYMASSVPIPTPTDEVYLTGKSVQMISSSFLVCRRYLLQTLTMTQNILIDFSWISWVTPGECQCFSFQLPVSNRVLHEKRTVAHKVKKLVDFH
jgi:hypothetical protein